MINLMPIDFTSIEKIKQNINLYKEKFIKDSVIIFRNANLNHEQHVEINKIFGQSLGWKNFGQEGKQVPNYTEDHSRLSDVLTSKNNDILVSWHIEHVYAAEPIVSASWNMTTFTTDTENGKTYFVDSEKLYKEIPDDWKYLLSRSIVSGKDFGPDQIFDDYDPVKNHWISGNPVIRLRLYKKNSSPNTLVSIDKRVPTVHEQKTFQDICDWFNNQVSDNEDIRLVHKWKQGDLVINDMFKLAHAVTGGFDPLHRKFTGIWGYKSN